MVTDPFAPSNEALPLLEINANRHLTSDLPGGRGQHDTRPQ